MAPANTLAKQANALVTLFIQEFTDKYDRKPTVNRYREKWGFQDMISDLGYDQAVQVVKYYFKTGKPGHPVQFLLHNYDALSNALEEKIKDEQEREKLRRETEARVSAILAQEGDVSG